MEKVVGKRDIKLSACNVSKDKYNELKYFCMQYQEKRRELQYGYGLKAAGNIGVSKGSGTGRPTEQAAIRNTMLRQDLELLEQTARDAAPDVYQWLLKSVTEGIAYEYLDVPLSRSRFYDVRRYFFFLLAQRR